MGRQVGPQHVCSELSAVSFGKLSPVSRLANPCSEGVEAVARCSSICSHSGKRAAAKDGERKRVLILMSDTGGGHRASAEALQAGFKQLYGDKFEVVFDDIWASYTPYPLNQLPKTYSFMVKHPIIWRWGYYTNQPRLMHRPTLAAMAMLVHKQVGGAFAHYQPDLIVSVHPLMQHMPLRILQKRVRNGEQKPTPFATVVTDLTTCHNTWFHPGVTRCFVPTDICRRRALRMGLRDEQVVVHGLPIRPAFAKRVAGRGRLRKKLGLDAHKPAVLLVGGGEGMGAIEKTMEAIAEAVGPACQVVAICGRNKKLAKRLQARSFCGMPVSVQGFVDNMPEWMSACDVIVTKAGPGTIAEALICGLPIILNGFVPCQEYGNLPFVLEQRVGAFEREPARIAELLRGWFGEQHGELAAMAQRAKRAGRPFQFALFRIVQDLATLASGPACAAAHASYVPA